MDHREDPASIRSLAVSPEDVVDAAACGRENPGEAVLRVTAPFHGRMRARLHVRYGPDERAAGTIHVAPDALLPDEVVASYPTREDVAADLGADGEYGDDERTSRTAAARREALAAWRERAEAAIVDAADLEIDGEPRRLSIVTLG